MENVPQYEEKQIDAETVKGLAHPLRVSIYDLLSTKGPATATMLAEKLGESSGSTSYHLRQLAKYGFIEETKPTSENNKERWWRRTPGGLTISPKNMAESPAAVQQSKLVIMQWQQFRQQEIAKFLDSYEVLGDELVDSSTLTSSTLLLTAKELNEFVTAYQEFLFQQREHFKNRDGNSDSDNGVQADADGKKSEQQPHKQSSTRSGVSREQNSKEENSRSGSSDPKYTIQVHFNAFPISTDY